jgi:hypothetical protein
MAGNQVPDHWPARKICGSSTTTHFWEAVADLTGKQLHHRALSEASAKLACPAVTFMGGYHTKPC